MDDHNNASSVAEASVSPNLRGKGEWHFRLYCWIVPRWRRLLYCGGGIGVAIVITVVCLQSYWALVLKKTFDLIEKLSGQPVIAFLVLAVVSSIAWVIRKLVHDGHLPIRSSLKLRMKTIPVAVGITAFVWTSVFLFYALLIASSKIYSEQSNQLQQTNEFFAKRISFLESSNVWLLSERTNEFAIKPVIGLRMSRSYWVDNVTNADGSREDMYGVPIAGKEGNERVGFVVDVTHPEFGAPMVISRVQVEVKAFEEKHGLVGEPQSGEYPAIEYTCELSPKAGFYECFRQNASQHSYVKIGTSDLEELVIYPKCGVPGVLTFNVQVEFSLGGKILPKKAETTVRCAFFDFVRSRGNSQLRPLLSP